MRDDEPTTRPTAREDWALRHLGNYQRAVQLAVLGRYGEDWQRPIANSMLSRWRSRATVLSGRNDRRIRQLLRIAWYTEHQLKGPLDHDGLLEIANQWTVVQSYFAVYSAGQAAQIALTGNEAGTHSAFLNAVSRQADSEAFPYPLSVRCKRHSPADVVGLSATFSREKGFNPTARPDLRSSEQYLYTAVRQTRDRQLKEKVSDWKKAHPGKRRVPNGFRAAKEPGLKTTTLLNLLYEMRRRAHYGDADVFVADGISQRDHERLLQGLIFVVDFINLVFETALAARGHLELLKDTADGLRLDRSESPAFYGRLDVLTDLAPAQR